MRLYKTRRRVAARILALPPERPIPKSLLLAALRPPKDARPWFAGSVPSSLACEPFIRRGDVIDVDVSLDAKPFAGCAVVAAYDMGAGRAWSYETVAPLLVFEGPGGDLYGLARSGPSPRLAETRVVGVVVRHEMRTGRDRERATVSWASALGVPFFLTPETYREGS